MKPEAPVSNTRLADFMGRNRGSRHREGTGSDLIAASDGEGGVVPAHAAFAIREIWDGHLIEDRSCHSGFEGVGKAGRDIDGSTIGFAEFKRLPLAVGWSLAPEIDHDIEDFAARAAYELALECGFGLVVQAAQGTLPAVERNTALHESFGEAMLRELLLAEGTGEGTALVCQRLELDQPG